MDLGPPEEVAAEGRCAGHAGIQRQPLPAHQAATQALTNMPAQEAHTYTQAGTQQPSSDSVQQSPDHLVQLLLSLLDKAAETGQAQHFIWTQSRLAAWLGSSNHNPAPQQQPSLVQRLPLVSTVVEASRAAKAAALAAGGSSSSSDVSGVSVGTFHLQLGGQQDAAVAAAATQQPGSGQQITLGGGAVMQQSAYPRLHHHHQQQQPHMTGLLQQLHSLHHTTAAAAEQEGPSCSSTVGAHQRQAAAAAAAAGVGADHSLPQLPHKEALPGDYEPVEPNPAWSAAALRRAAAAAAAKLGLPALQAPPAPATTAQHQQPSCSGEEVEVDALINSSTTSSGAAAAQWPRFGVLMLVHEKGVAAAEVWQAWEAAHEGKAVVRIHLKAGVSTARLPGKEWISSRALPSRVASQWGCISLTAAMLKAAADMLRAHPHLQHIALVSGQDVPTGLVPLRDLRPGLSLFGRFQFGRAFDAAASRVAADLLQQQLGMSQRDAKAWGDALVFHHTWMVLDRQLLLALISKEQELLRVGAVLNQRFMQPDVAVAADEFLLVTAAVRYGFVKEVAQKKLQPYMAALRRQHRQQVSETEGELRRKQEKARRCVDWSNPLKLPRLADAPPGAPSSAAAAPDGPAAAADASAAAVAPAADAVVTRGSRRSGSSIDTASTSRPSSSCSGVAGGASKDAEGVVGSRSSSRRSRVEGVEPQQQQEQQQEQPQQKQGQHQAVRTTLSGQALVGHRIKVWWPADQAWYSGTVKAYELSSRKHTVQYDDGDTETITLCRQKWQLLLLNVTAAAKQQRPAAPDTTQGRSTAASAPLPQPPQPQAPSSSSLVTRRTVSRLQQAAAGGGASVERTSAHAAAAAAAEEEEEENRSSVLREGSEGVLLDCCPTLALFHPDQTRHPHEWRTFSECLLVDVNSARRGHHKLMLLEALGLAAPNAALFFRKVAPMQSTPGAAQLMGCLNLLWRGKPLPAMVEELELEGV